MWQDNSAPTQAKEGRRWKEETTLSKKVDTSRGKDVHIKHEDDDKKKQKHMGKCAKWWAYSSLRVKWTVIFILTNIFYACYGFMKALINKPYMPTSYYFAKAGGGILNFNCAVILVPVLRNILSWLRTTPVKELLPLDDNIIFHKIIFVGIIAATTLHVVAHYITFSDFSYEDPNFTAGSGVLSYAFLTFEGFTGHAILFMMMCMCLTALECCRRKTHKICCCPPVGGYSLFWAAHKLWIPCMLVLLLHARNFWSYGTWPLLLMFLEKLIQKYRSKQEIELLEVRALPSDVLTIKFRPAHNKKFRYKAGQYIYINCPAVSKKEWHPFTLSSAPEDPYLSCHIRCSKHLDWCYPFRQLLNPNDASIIRYDKGQTPYGTKEQSKSPRSKSGGKRRSSSKGKQTSKGGSKVQPVRAVSKDKTNDIRNDIYKD